MDAMWLMKQMESGKMSVLECLAERESINRLELIAGFKKIHKDSY